MTASPRRRAMQERRSPGERGRWRPYSVSSSWLGERCSGRERIPCLGNSPRLGRTWQRPKRPRPPQTESMSTPKARAASRTVVPTGKRPRRPEGVKTTKTSPPSGSPLRPPPSPVTPWVAGTSARFRRAQEAATVHPPGSLDGRLPVGSQPGGGVGVVAHEDVGGKDRLADLRPEGIGDRRRQSGPNGHGQEGGVDPLTVGEAKADVRSATGGVHLELFAKTADEAEDLLAGAGDGADGHDQGIDDDVLARDPVVGRPLDDLPRHLEPD